MKGINPNEVAEQLCIEAESLGLCHPTQSMIADRLLDVICNVLNFPVETAQLIDGNQNSTAMQMHRALHAAREACGPLADAVAHDMDHKCKDHSKWYKAVETFRKEATHEH